MTVGMKRLLILVLLLIVVAWPRPGVGAVVDYHLVISRQEVSPAGKAVPGMTINGSIPGPTLRFREGDIARIQVENRMEVETSIHWHGILVPPGMDGVPAISFPAIQPGTTFTYQFPIRQSGTYWYHSHSHLQEQRGVYGAIVIHPAAGQGSSHGHQRVMAPHETVVVFSDWTNQDPQAVLRTLKRGSDWFALDKGSGQSLLGAARLGMAGDYLAREWMRMPPMDIADVAYDAFLANGRRQINQDAKPGEIVRLRLVNGSASTYFHLQFAGGKMTIIAADGQDVEPAEKELLLMAVAETYDLLVKLPEAGAFELRATAHDGSGHASLWLGRGARHAAPDVPRPNLYHVMGGRGLAQALALTPAGTMGMSDDAVRAGRFDQPGMAMEMGAPGMSMAAPAPSQASAHAAEHGGPSASKTEMKTMSGMGSEPTAARTASPGHGHDQDMSSPPESRPGQDRVHTGFTPPQAAMAGMSGQADIDEPGGGYVRHHGLGFGWLAGDVATSASLARDGGPERPWPPYAILRATRSTALKSGAPLREIRLTLDGDMERYVWLINDKALSEQDDIVIRRGETVHLIMINRTMMHHPMHLHGHFFRVVNGQGDRSPLKHTVDVAPMSTTVIEFDSDETGDWFFHCHLLYHMMSGMARMVHYYEHMAPPEVAAIRPGLYADSWWFWGQASLLSQMSEGFLRLANTRQVINASWEMGWQKTEETEWESLLTWAYHPNRFLSFFVGADNLGQRWRLEKTRGVAGVGYLLPFNLESRFWIDTDGGGRVRLERSFHLTPRLAVNGEAEYDTHTRWEGAVGFSYSLTRDLSLAAKWHSEYAWGAGLELRF